MVNLQDDNVDFTESMRFHPDAMSFMKMKTNKLSQ